MSGCSYVGNFAGYNTDFSNLIFTDGVYYDGYSSELMLLHGSLYDNLLSFPLPLKQYTKIQFSQNLCLDGNEGILMQISDFSHHDQFLIGINGISIILLIVLFIYGVIKIFKRKVPSNS